MFHYIFDIAMQNIAKPVNRVCFDVTVLFQSIDLGSVHIMMRIKVILRNPFIFHCFPQSVIFYHRTPILNFLLTNLSMAIK